MDNEWLNTLLFACLFVLAFYHLGFFIIRKYSFLVLYFAIFTLIASFMLLINDKQSVIALPGNYDYLLPKLDYLIFFLSSVFFFLFLYKLYLKEVFRKLLKVFVIFSIVFIGMLFIINIDTSSLLNLYKAGVMLLGIYVYVVLMNPDDREKKEFFILIVGGSILLVAFVNKIFFLNDFFQKTKLNEIALFLFVLSQSYLILVQYPLIYTDYIGLAYKRDPGKQAIDQRLEDQVPENMRDDDKTDIKQGYKYINDELEKQKAELLRQRKEMENINRLLEIEKAKADNLLFNMLPREVVEELKKEGVAKTKMFSNVSVMFLDFVGFSKVSQTLTPEELIKELHHCFSAYDDILHKYSVDKIKTIGDAYMCAGGLTNKEGNWTVATVLAAQEIGLFMNKYKEARKNINKPYFNTRTGIHSGQVIAGVVGKSKFAFDIWGHTVNTASSMESACQPGLINISYDVYKQIKKFFQCESRGKISVKHETDLEMFYVKRIYPEFSADEKGFIPNKLLLEEGQLNRRFDNG